MTNEILYPTNYLVIDLMYGLIVLMSKLSLAEIPLFTGALTSFLQCFQPFGKNNNLIWKSFFIGEHTIVERGEVTSHTALPLLHRYTCTRLHKCWHPRNGHKVEICARHCKSRNIYTNMRGWAMAAYLFCIL